MILPGSGVSKSALNPVSFTILKPLGSKRGVSRVRQMQCCSLGGRGARARSEHFLASLAQLTDILAVGFEQRIPAILITVLTLRCYLKTQRIISFNLFQSE